MKITGCSGEPIPGVTVSLKQSGVTKYGPGVTSSTGQVCFSTVAEDVYDVVATYSEYGTVNLGTTTVSCPQGSVPVFTLCDWASIPDTLTLSIGGNTVDLVYQTGGPLGDGWAGCMRVTPTGEARSPGGTAPDYCGAITDQVNIYWLLTCDPGTSAWSISAYIPGCGFEGTTPIDLDCPAMFDGSVTYTGFFSCVWVTDHLEGDAFTTCNPFQFQFTITPSQTCNPGAFTQFSYEFLNGTLGSNLQGTVS